MYAVTGITGNVGGVVAKALLAAGLPIRAVVRNPERAASWAAQGCEIAAADVQDSAALVAAFKGAEAAFVMIPPIFDPAPGFPEAEAIGNSLISALATAKPGRVVYLSTIGAQAEHENLLSQHTLIEKKLQQIDLPITFLRPGWFMENAAWDIASARSEGLLHSFLFPVERAIPMVATADIGHTAAELLQEPQTSHRIVELEGPRRVSPLDIAATFSHLLGRPVTASVVPHETWKALFLSQGMKNPEPRIRMLDGFNEGWIDFEGRPAAICKGQVELETVLKALLASA